MTHGSTRWLVGGMAASEMRPDPQAWAEYQRVFPFHWWKWNADRQLFEIWMKHPVTGAVHFVEFVYWWDVHDPDRTTEPSEEEMLEMLRRNDPRLVKVYRALGWQFVRERIADYWRFRAFTLKELSKGRQAKNKAVSRRHVRASAHRVAGHWAEMRNWLPAIASGDVDDRIKQVPVGVQFSERGV